jgi:hypothetical protein
MLPHVKHIVRVVGIMCLQGVDTGGLFACQGMICKRMPRDSCF